MAPLSTTPVPLSEMLAEDASALEAIECVKRGMRFVRRQNNPRRRTGIAFDHVGKLGILRRRHLKDLRAAFAQMLEQLGCFLNSPPPVAVIGLSESGIVPSYAMATTLRITDAHCDWICTTRDADRCRGDMIAFQEPHSHAPGHFLDISSLSQHDTGEVWIVEDELTTGRTVANLVASLSKRSSAFAFRVFAIADLRSPAHRHAFDRRLSALGLSRVTCHALFGIDSVPQGVDETPMDSPPNPSRVKYVRGEQLVRALPWVDQRDDYGLRQFTLSPWVVDGTVIRNRIAVGDDHYLYNASDDESAVANELFQDCNDGRAHDDH